jgi:hypothetical protein
MIRPEVDRLRRELWLGRIVSDLIVEQITVAPKPLALVPEIDNVIDLLARAMGVGRRIPTGGDAA